MVSAVIIKFGVIPKNARNSRNGSMHFKARFFNNVKTVTNSVLPTLSDQRGRIMTLTDMGEKSYKCNKLQQSQTTHT